MTSRDSDAWRELFGVVCATYDRIFDEAQSKFYWDALRDLELVDLKASAIEIAKTSKWFPKPAEWRQVIGVQRFNERRARELELAQRSLTERAHCEECSDTGWRVVQVEPERVAVCPCRTENPNYQAANAKLRLGDDESGTPQIPDQESRKILTTVRDFKRLSSGG